MTTTKAKNYYNPNDLLHSHSHWGWCECEWQWVCECEWQSVVLYFSLWLFRRFRSFHSVDMYSFYFPFYFVFFLRLEPNRRMIEHSYKFLFSSTSWFFFSFFLSSFFCVLLFPHSVFIEIDERRIRIYIFSTLLILYRLSRARCPMHITCERKKKKRGEGGGGGEVQRILLHISIWCVGIRFLCVSRRSIRILIMFFCSVIFLCCRLPSMVRMCLSAPIRMKTEFALFFF